MASPLRALAMDAVEEAKSGHPGMPMGMADVATVLFAKHLVFDASAPGWPDRDRFILSAGHGSMLLYALLHLSGYADMPISKLKNFRQLGGGAAGHPEYGDAAGIETTTGPLGQGLANGVGMALAEKMRRARHGERLVNHRTYVIAGDGCLMEGISQEAISLAGHLKLEKLIVLWDDNGISIDGSIDLTDSTDQLARFAASGWNTMSIDGHDYDAIDNALTEAKKSEKPTLIACRTLIGYGAPTKSGSAAAHGAPLGADEIAATRKALGWKSKPFSIPKDAANLWKETSARGASIRAVWQKRFERLSAKKQAEFISDPAAAKPAAGLSAAVKRRKQEISEEAAPVATRRASQQALETVLPFVPQLIGGSADLTGSNNTKTADLDPIHPADFSGRYIHYGIREHAMAAMMNGMALHGGVIPYGGTFLVFSDYARPAIRLSALMQLGVVYVMTHDSIGLGEDGPTHQPVEHLAALRAIPNLAVYRPADAIETLEAWELAINDRTRPSVLALSRQTLPLVRTEHTIRNLTERGAYVLKEADTEGSARPKAVLIATGSEVEIALAARELLQKEGVPTRVVSAPCLERFAEQDEKYRARVLPRGPVRVVVEAAVRDGWDRWLCGERGDFRKADFVGMSGFGASGPYKELYAQFGITAEAVAEKAKALAQGKEPAVA
ncbi:MAG: transketolase [Neomegalonema sp.]|nr:transketolase [Neomegalonema sp.]